MATPYAHSFCDKFLGALRHTTPSILRQRGSAATIIIIASSIYMLIVLTTFRNTLVLFQIQYNYACY